MTLKVLYTNTFDLLALLHMVGRIHILEFIIGINLGKGQKTSRFGHASCDTCPSSANWKFFIIQMFKKNRSTCVIRYIIVQPPNGFIKIKLFNMLFPLFLMLRVRTQIS